MPQSDSENSGYGTESDDKKPKETNKSCHMSIIMDYLN